MTCERCGHGNRASARFCEACGAALAVVEGERKQVTVLFADVVRSMELAEALGPETWRAVMARLLSVVVAAVDRFGGTVEAFTGDGAMAVFGSPVAQEDHAVRACHAALALSGDLAELAGQLEPSVHVRPAMRIGLDSGEVVTGALGVPGDLAQTAIGHTVGLAKRMESLAEPGRPHLSAHTASLVEGLFVMTDLGEVAVKGARAPLHVFALEGAAPARNRLEAAAARGLSRLVGRDAELAALDHAWRAAASGTGQAVGLVGEAGVGKSRLCAELTSRCRAAGAAVYAGRGLAHATGAPFLAILEMLRGYFGILPSDDGREARAKVAGGLPDFAAEDADALPLLFDFLGVPDPEHPPPAMDPEARGRRLLAALDRITRARGEEVPILIVVEDLHWIDHGSERFLDNLVAGLPGTRTLVLVTFRPGYSAAWMQRSWFTRLSLGRLGREATGALVTGLLGTDPSLGGLTERVIDRTDGNPLFVEEVVRALVEAGAVEGAPGAYRLGRGPADLAIPPTVQSVLAARIDRLADRERAVLRSASVAGHEFSEALLRKICMLPDDELGEALDVLLEAELLLERGMPPRTEYVFRHALVQEVAYHAQLSEDRIPRHRAAAEATELLEADRLDERAAVIAHHWEAAGDMRQTAAWSARAASWAGFRDPVEAVRHWSKVRRLTAEPDHDEMAALGLQARLLLLDLAWRLGAPGGDARAHLRQVAELAGEGELLIERSGQHALRAWLLAGHASVLGIAGRPAAAIGMAREALRLAREGGDRSLEVQSLRLVSHLLWTLGALDEALATTKEGLELAGTDRAHGIGVADPHSAAAVERGIVLAWAGRLAESRAMLQDGLRLAVEAGDVEVQTWLHAACAGILGNLGGLDPDVALEHAHTGLDLAERLGSTVSRVWSYAALGIASGLVGRWTASCDAIGRALELARERGTALEGEPWLLAQRAHSALGSGHADAARATAEEAVALATARSARGFEAIARCELARAMTASADLAAAREQVQLALDLVDRTGMHGYRPRVQTALEELMRAADRPAPARAGSAPRTSPR